MAIDVAGIDPQPNSDTPLKIQAWEVPASRHYSAAPKGKSRCSRRVYSLLSCMKSLAAGGTSTWENTCPYVTKRKRPLRRDRCPRAVLVAASVLATLTLVLAISTMKGCSQIRNTNEAKGLL